MRYLTFTCFDPDAPGKAIQKHLMNGYYAFQDYASVHWIDHLECLVPFLGLDSADSFDELPDAINEFHATFGAGDE
jgi:hypothetical protein